MKQLTDNRILEAKEVSKEELVDKIKLNDPIRFDQMLIETEERKNYIFVKYNSLAYTRKPKTLKFPLFKDLVNDFEKSIDKSGEIKILEDDRIIQKLIAQGKEPIDTPKYSGKSLVFSDLKISTENNIVKLKQPVYYIPSETDRCTCNTCKGDMYTTCTKSECRGQHIYDCNKCGTSGSVDCTDCKGQGEKKCSTCNGIGTIKCKGYVSSGGTSGAASNAVYSCSNGKAACRSCFGKGCFHCRNTGKSTCPTCNGAGRNTCSKKNNSNYGIGKLFDTIGGVDFCGGSGKIECKPCDSKGQVKCKKCQGEGRIECNTCYDDHKDNRYGKVDCVTCETAGEIASITYIETEIKTDNIELICTDGKQIDAPSFGVETLKKYVNTNGQTALVYKNINGDNKEAYDDYSSFVSKNAMMQVGISKDKYPKILLEELYYEGVPCATYNYNHILSASFHDVSILSIDKEQDVLFHSNPTAVADEKESLKKKIDELCRRAFSTKAYKDKIDRKHEMFLMVHMAKADGIIEEQEKKYLAKTVTGLHGFTNKEKAELFGLMSSNTLPPISRLNAYFSSRERAEEARIKIVELVAKADGEYEPEEKAKMEEINNAIDSGFKSKPSAIGQFFKTWQISASIFIILSMMSFSSYYISVLQPIENAKSLHLSLFENQKKLEYFLSPMRDNNSVITDSIYDVDEAEDIMKNLNHNSDLEFSLNGKEVQYRDYWKLQKDKLTKLFEIYLLTHNEKKDNKTNAKTESTPIAIDTTAVSAVVGNEESDMGGPAGEIVIGVGDRIYLYNESNYDSKTSAYFVKGQKAEYFEVGDDNPDDEFIYINFTNDKGHTSTGYVLISDIRFE